ncbi:hypothetical protein CBW65_06880 [Tumebacillus avium]|uniref:PhnB-like domain-containing protein n=1 Tax=Tumebacillus avium TaxID=1903704 RepID=A0A1Y0ILD8_9BACL|nr:VOC family protein [Tumebacillus avium]ARU60849.1 hypothetical protein CBW65_06880 [Tumebacillus avium]
MKLIPYLSFHGQAEEAMKFYADALNGEVTQLGRYSEAPGMQVPEGFADKVLHGRLQIQDTFLYFSDVDRDVNKGDQVSLTLEFESEEAIDAAFAKLSAGGTVHVPLDKTFWGAKYSKLVDKYGMQWDLNYQY